MSEGLLHQFTLTKEQIDRAEARELAGQMSGGVRPDDEDDGDEGGVGVAAGQSELDLSEAE